LAVAFQDIDPDDLKQRLETYSYTYYAELREVMSQYSVIAESFPYWLKGPKAVLATLCTDGILVTHWAAKEDRFAFGVSTRTVTEVSDAQTYGPRPLGPYLSISLNLRSTDYGEYEFAHHRIHQGEGTSGPIVWQAPWDRTQLWILREVEDWRWSEADAVRRATRDALAFANAHLMGLQRVEPNRQRDVVIARIEEAIREFRALLDTQPGEEEVQRYLSEDRNKILLHPEAVNISPKVRLGAEYVPDFVIELPRKRYVYVEIEQPKHQVITQNGRPSAKLTDATQQVEDWFRWTSDNIAYARSILPDISEPSGKVILGRETGIPPQHREVLRRRNVEHHRIESVTFDDLLENAEQHLSNLRAL
jgi:hypothetical protein